MLELIWDMETNDPDDFLTLLLLAGHPQVKLKAVTVTPGTPHQIGLVRHALTHWFGLDLPIGAYDLNRDKDKTKKPVVSPWHYQAYGEIGPSWQAEPGWQLLLREAGPQTTLLTGGPLKNLKAAIKAASVIDQPSSSLPSSSASPSSSSSSSFELERLVVQGGFAGEGVVPPELQLPKFKGLTTCPSYNLNADPKAVLVALSYPRIGRRYFVSKNVCHRVVYDQQMHSIVAEVKKYSPSLSYIWQGMEVYLKEHPEGKLLHDPLAACCAIDPSLAQWAEVELYRQSGEWGARLAPGSNTWIIVDYDHPKFLELFTAY